MKNKTYVVMIPVNYNNSLDVCENLENKMFESISDLQKEIDKQLNQSFVEPPIYQLTYFMQAINTQDMEDLLEYFITYVTINE